MDYTEEEKLKAILDENIDSALNYVEQEVEPDRVKADQYYKKMPFGNEVKGKSSVIDSTVQEVIQSSLGQLVKPFLQGSDIVEFTATKEGGAELATTVTDYVNHIFHSDNDGAQILRTWMFDALLLKTGIVKAYWDDDTDATPETYEGLSSDELAMLMSDDVEIVEQEELLGEEVQVGQDPVTGEPLIQRAPSTYNVKVMITTDASKVKIENVDPSEFLIDKHTTSIKDSTFVAQRQMLTRAQLVDMGYDKAIVDELSTDDELGLDSDFDFSSDDDTTTDKTQELIAYYECYLDIGNDKGQAVKHRVCYASKKILSSEEIDYIPFYSLCPFPLPHQFYGQSMADHTMDLQFIKSTIMRQMLDNLYLTNNSRVGAVEGQVNLDDLLNSTAGGIIRMKNPNAIVPMQVQSSASQSFPMLEYLDQMQAKRTGINDLAQGIDANVLQNVSATAVATMTAQSQGKIELIARVFADTGIKELMQGILHLVCKYQNEPREIKIAGKPMMLDPREWTNNYNVKVNVGLGNGTGDEKVAMIQMILAKQEQILQQYGVNNPLVTLKQYRETLAKFINASGFADDAQFMNEISDQALQQIQQADAQADKTPPEVKAAQAIAQAEMEKAKMKAQTDMAAQQLKMQELQAKVEQEQKELQLQQQQQQLDADRQMLDIETERAKLEADIQLREQDLAIKEQKNQITASNDDMKNMINAVDKMAKASNGEV